MNRQANQVSIRRIFLYFLVSLTAILIYLCIRIWNNIQAESTSDLIYTGKIIQNYYDLSFRQWELTLTSVGKRVSEIPPEQPQQRLEYINESQRIYNELLAFGYADPSGAITVFSGRQIGDSLPNLQLSEDSRRSFQLTKESDGLVIGESYYFSNVGDWILPLRVPIFDSNNKLIAVNTSALDFKSIYADLDQLNFDESYDIHFINNAFGITQFYYPLASDLYQEVLLKEEVIYSQLDSIGFQNGILSFKSFNNQSQESVLGVRLHMKDWNHDLVVMMPYEHLKAQFFKEIRAIVITYFLIVLITAIILKYYKKNQTLYIEKIIASEKKLQIFNEKLELTVDERTQELADANERINTSFESLQNLSAIGKEIISTLSFETIIEKVYNHLSGIVPADSVYFGYYNIADNTLYFPGSIEKGKLSKPFSYDLKRDANSLSVTSFKESKALKINDIVKEFPQYKNPRPVEVPQSAIVVPLVHSGIAIGVFAVNSLDKHVYSDYHLNLIESIATYLTIAVLNSQAYQQLDKAKKEVAKQKESYQSSYETIKTLSEIGTKIISSLSIETIVERVYKNVNDLVVAESFTFGVYNEDQNILEFIGGMENGKKQDYFAYDVDRDLDRLAVKCFNSRKPVITNDLLGDYPNYPPAVQGELPDSVIYVPLYQKDRTIGTLNVSSYTKGTYTDYDISLLQNLGIYISIALENAQTYQKLSNSYDQLKELDGFKESMTGMIVHDFKNSLNTVINFSEGKPTERRMQSIRQAGQFMLNMVMNILDVQKFEETNPKLSLANYSISSLAKLAVDQLTYMMEQKSIKLSVSQEHAYYVRVDHDLFVRVIVNILSNAIKYSPQNGEIAILITEDSGLVHVSISDQGPGIPEDKLQAIFDKYQQVEARKEGAARSTGIGLTFCKMVVEAHKGEIGVQSKEGEGSTFFFTLEMLKDGKEAEPIEIIKWELNQDIRLSTSEVEKIKSSLLELKKWEVFDYSEVMAVLNDIDQESENISSWKDAVKKALQNGNEELYNSLINQ